MEDHNDLMKHQKKQNEVQKPITTAMQRRIIGVKRELDDYIDHLGDLSYLLDQVQDPLSEAQAAAERMLAKDLFKNWRKAEGTEKGEVDAFFIETKNHQQKQNNVQRLTALEQQQLGRFKQRLDDYIDGLGDVFKLLDDVRYALSKAQGVAECLLANNPFKAWQERKRLEQEEFDAVIRADSMKHDDLDIED